MSAQTSTGDPPGPVNSQVKSITKKKSWFCGRMLWQCAAALPVILLVIIYNMPYLISEYRGIYGYGQAEEYNDLPSYVLDEFRSYDINFDDRLDPYEFYQVLQELKTDDSIVDPNRTANAKYEYYDPEASVTAELLTVVAKMKPMDIKTMTKFQGEYGKEYEKNAPKLLPGLIAWQESFQPIHAFAVGNFKMFLPKNTLDISSPYYVIDTGYQGKMPHMNYYHPPHPQSSSEAFLYALLSMFHPNAFINCRFGPRGTVAMVRAENEAYYDILIRAHAEYQLNEYPDFPFWFTPGQFQGRLIISKNASHVEYFEMGIVTKKSLNIDMEWITGKNENEVDIGFMPEMRLYSPVPSELVTDEYSTPLEQQKYDFDQLHWDYEIPVDEGYSRIEKKMYPFKEIPYLDYLEAFEVAKIDNKLDIIANSSLTEEQRNVAKLSKESYSFPVEMMVIRSNGEVLTHLNANNLFDMDNGGLLSSAENAYSNFLKQGVAAAEQQAN